MEKPSNVETRQRLETFSSHQYWHSLFSMHYLIKIRVNSTKTYLKKKKFCAPLISDYNLTSKHILFPTSPSSEVLDQTASIFLARIFHEQSTIMIRLDLLNQTGTLLKAHNAQNLDCIGTLFEKNIF